MYMNKDVLKTGNKVLESQDDAIDFDSLPPDMQKAFLDMLENEEDSGGLKSCDEASKEYIEDNIVLVDTIDVELDSKIPLDSFQRGIDKMAEMCGSISALVSVGITPSKAMDFLVSQINADKGMKHEAEMIKIQANASVESAKYESANAQKAMI